MEEELKLTLAKKATILMLSGIEPRMGEKIDEYVKRGEKILLRMAGEKQYGIRQ